MPSPECAGTTLWCVRDRTISGILDATLNAALPLASGSKAGLNDVTKPECPAAAPGLCLLCDQAGGGDFASGRN